jgi:protein TonB
MSATAYPSFGTALPGRAGGAHGGQAEGGHHGAAPASPDSNPSTPGPLARLGRRFGPLAAVIALHLVLGYAVLSGTAVSVIDAALPKAVEVVIVSTPAPKQEPVTPPTVEIAPLVPPVMEPPPVPVIQIAPSERAITLPPPAPAAPTPAAKPVSAPVVLSAPPAPPVPSTPRTVTSGVEYLQKPEPVYPPLSRRLGETGKVVLRVLINENGRADKVTVETSSGFSRLDEAARQAAQRALFKPYIEDGRAVPAYVIVPLDFKLG